MKLTSHTEILPLFLQQKSTFTSFTAPELEVHIALVLAKPTVEPSKSTPLNEEENKCLDTGSNTATHHLGIVFQCVLRDELCVVMFIPQQQALLTPLEEAAEGDLRVSADLYLISVRPDVQTDQHHTDTNRAIQLAKSGMLAQTDKWKFPCKLQNSLACLLCCLLSQETVWPTAFWWCIHAGTILSVCKEGSVICEKIFI